LTPSFSLLLSVEMLRDGGSLAAMFQGADSAEYWLVLPVRTRELPSGSIERIGYDMPVLVDRQTGQEKQVSWQHARTILSQARAMLQAEDDRQWLEYMVETASKEGLLPAGVTPLP
jgi:hypothetical protein